MFNDHVLSIILFTPMVGAFILLFVPKENKNAIRWLANMFALAGLAVSIPLIPSYQHFHYSTAVPQATR